MFPVLVLVVFILVPFIAAFGAALALGVLAAMQTRTRARHDLDDMAAKVVTQAAQYRGYNSPTLAVVPVVGRLNAWHVVMKGRHERIVTAWNLAMVHTLVLGHLAACHAR